MTAGKRSQNVTITLPEDELTEAKHMAVDEGVSLSHFVANLIRERVTRGRRYRAAMEREFARMEHSGFQLGKEKWSRDDIYRR